MFILHQQKRVYDIAMRTRRIVILGSYGTTNLGDEAILTAMLKLLNQYCPGSIITVICPHPDRVASLYDVRVLSSHRTKDILKKIQTFRCADILILGGGGLLQDNRRSSWMTGMISTYVTQALLAKLYGCRVALVGVSIGPLFSDSSRKFVSFLCKVCDIIITRDKESKALALQLGGNTRSTFSAADLTLCLDSEDMVSSASVELFPNDKRYCVLSLRPSYAKVDLCRPFGIPQKSIDSLCSFLRWMIEERGFDIVFIPFDPVYDIALGEYIAQLLGNTNRFHLYVEQLSVNSLLRVLACAKATIGMRLHSLILSFVVGTSVVPLVYDTKVANFARQINISEALTIETLELESLQQAFTKALLVSISSDSQEQLKTLRQSIHSAFQELSRLLGSFNDIKI